MQVNQPVFALQDKKNPRTMSTGVSSLWNKLSGCILREDGRTNLFLLSGLPLSRFPLSGFLLGSCFFGRITSYNVCYTKLLRAINKALSASVYLTSKIIGAVKPLFNDITGGSLTPTNLNVCSSWLKITVLLVEELSLPSPSSNRITSYNVCYTKLLRWRTCKSCL